LARVLHGQEYESMAHRPKGEEESGTHQEFIQRSVTPRPGEGKEERTQDREGESIAEGAHPS
jgi:hypothetical protein